MSGIRAAMAVAMLAVGGLCASCGHSGSGSNGSSDVAPGAETFEMTGDVGAATTSGEPLNPYAGHPVLLRLDEPVFSGLFPGVRADLDKKIVEFDAIVSPMLVVDPDAPLFFVETLVCAPDTREHESLLVTSVKPSHLHAALLAIGLTPGAPGQFKFDNERGTFSPVDATGDRVRISVLREQDVVRFGDVKVQLLDAPQAEPRTVAGPVTFSLGADPRTWLINAADRGKSSPAPRRFGSEASDVGAGWVFAGSAMRKMTDKSGNVSEVYDADGTGVVVGFCCFGSEVVAWSRTFSPDASIDEPEWIADFSRTPPAGTPVRVRVRAEDR